MTAQTISAAGLALIRDHEGFRAEPAQMPHGGWLVGHGHVRDEAGEPVSEAEALNLLKVDLTPVEGVVRALVTQPLTQSQFDALVSFAFSIGAEAFVQSQVLRRLNAGEYVAAACAMDAWRKGEVAGELEVLEALVRRRAAEKAMFLEDTQCARAASALVRARLDHAASVLGAPMKFAAAPDIISAPVAAAQLVTAPLAAELPAEMLTSETQTDALLLTQVVPSDVPDATEDAREVAIEAATEAAAEIAAAPAQPVARAIPFVELPIDRRIRDNEKGGEKGGVAGMLKAVWGVVRAPKPQRA